MRDEKWDVFKLMTEKPDVNPYTRSLLRLDTVPFFAILNGFT